MFQSLVDKMSQAFSKFRNKGKLTEADVKAGMREVKLALLEADVNFKVVKDFVAKVTERAVGSEVLESLVPSQQIVKIVNEELVALMGGTNSRLEVASKPPTVILMCGLQGSGKTTHCAKLGKMLKKSGKNVRHLPPRRHQAASGRGRAGRTDRVRARHAGPRPHRGGGREARRQIRL